MAGDWIPIDHELPNSPQVASICGQTADEVGTVCGRLSLFWIRIDRFTTDGVLKSMDLRAASVAFGGTEAFWQAVENVGWVRFSERGMEMPGFEERFGKSAKRRMLDAKRKAEVRADKSSLRTRRRTRSGRTADKMRTRCGRDEDPVSVSYIRSPYIVPLSKAEQLQALAPLALPAPFDRADVRDALASWLAYLPSKGKPVLDPAPVAMAAVEMFAWSTPEHLVAEIHRAIANQWANLRTDGEQKPKRPKPLGPEYDPPPPAKRRAANASRPATAGPLSGDARGRDARSGDPGRASPPAAD